MAWHKRWLAGWGTAMLVGTFFFVTVFRLDQARPIVPLALFGAFYGLAVLGLIRIFGVRRWGLLVAGLLCGPVPASVLHGLFNRQVQKPGDLGGALVLGVLLGLFVGLLEWARQSRVESDRDDG